MSASQTIVHSKAGSKKSHHLQRHPPHTTSQAAGSRLTGERIQRALSEPRRLHPTDVLALQSSIGNAAVSRMIGQLSTQSPNHLSNQPAGAMGTPVIQHKLQVGPVNDRYEQEADRVAGQVMRSVGKSAQRHGEGEEQSVPHSLDRSITPVARRTAKSAPAAQTQTHKTAKDGSFDADANLENRVKRMSGGIPLPDTIRREFEPHFGADFSGVRLHTGAEAVQLNRDMSARAFTYGNHIAFNANQYNPGSTSGKSLLAHELTHVVQQKGSAVRRKSEHSPAAEAVSPTLQAPTKIQRRFGFEIETPILITQDRPLKNSTTEVAADPKVPKHPIAAEHDDFAVHIDHNSKLGDLERYASSGPIVELVTKPMDEFALTEDEVEDKMQGLVDFANAAEARTNNFTSRAPLNGVGGVTPTTGKLHIGSDSDKASIRQGKSGDIQVTYGIKLERTGEAFRMHASVNDSEEVPKILMEAADNGEAAAKAIVDRYQDAKHYINEEGKAKTRKFKNKFTIQQTDMPQLTGLLTLMSNYLVAGRGTRVLGVGWDKNKLGMFFYKSQLSSVRESLTGAADTLLKNRADKVGNILLAANGRSGNEPVIPGNRFTAKEWVTQIFEGKRDTLFQGMKNAYGSEIKPEEIGPEGSKSTAAVMENRKLGLLQKRAQGLLAQLQAKKGNLGQGGSGINTWIPTAKKIYKALRIINGAGQPSQDDWNDLMG